MSIRTRPGLLGLFISPTKPAHIILDQSRGLKHHFCHDYFRNEISLSIREFPLTEKELKASPILTSSLLLQSCSEHLYYVSEPEMSLLWPYYRGTRETNFNIDILP